ncbi:ABC transporter permease [Streptomyces sp. NPDC055078]
MSALHSGRTLLRYVVRRLCLSLVLLVLLSVVVFAGVDVLPGDAVSGRAGGALTPEQIADIRQQLGLRRPLIERYGRWAGGLLHGDLGTSLVSGRPVGSLMGRQLGNSVLLALLTVLVAAPLSLVLGMWAGARRGRPADRVVSAAAILLVAFPEYVFAGALVLIFAIGLDWLPAVSLVPPGDSPLQHPDLLVLPVLSLVLLSLAYAARVVRAATAAALREPHVESARLNGQRETVLLRRAVLPAVLPVAAQIWCVLGVGLVGGAILVERVFGYPGVGELLVNSVRGGDLPVAQALAMVLGAAMLVALLVADLVVVLMTPRLRTEAV